MSFSYISDGSGRDSYVVQNSGGLVNDFRCVPTESFFKSQLRKIDRSNLPHKRTHLDGSEITDFLNWITPSDRIKVSKIAKYQRQLDARLSPPKNAIKI